MKFVKTEWEVWTYDVWGNQKEGWEVNDRSCQARNFPLTLRVRTHNKGTPMEFSGAYPSDKQIRNAFGLKRIRLNLDGDDMRIYVNYDATNYPIGEMICTSHESLSPIRKKEGTK